MLVKMAPVMPGTYVRTTRFGSSVNDQNRTLKIATVSIPKFAACYGDVFLKAADEPFYNYRYVITVKL